MHFSEYLSETALEGTPQPRPGAQLFLVSPRDRSNVCNTYHNPILSQSPALA
jgi:hypothetical protein